MAAQISSRYDGFPRPGPSFNPLKFKSIATYRYYTQLEAQKTTAKDHVKATEQKVNSVVEKPREDTKQVLTNIPGKVKHEEKEHALPTKALESEQEKTTSLSENKSKKKTVGMKQSRWEDFTRPGPSSNPIKDKSTDIYPHFMKLEQGCMASDRDAARPGEKKLEVASASETYNTASNMTGIFTEVVKPLEAQSACTTIADTNQEQHPRPGMSRKPAFAALNAWGEPLKTVGTTKKQQSLNSSIAHRACPTTEQLSSEVAKICAAAKEERPDATETIRLVSIRRIKSVHETKVNNRWYSLAQIDGWVCLVPRGSFKPGELVLYLEIDAFIPAADERFGKQMPLITLSGQLGHRVKTRRLGSGADSVLVQGLVYPLERFPEINADLQIVREAMETVQTPDQVMNSILLALYRKENWAEKLGILKWNETKQTNKAAQQQDLRVGKIPSHLFPKTDISRLEDCPNLFIKSKYKSLEYQESVKMDGASMTVYFVSKESRLFRQLNAIPDTAEVGPHMELENGRFGVCSKNVDMHELNKNDPMGYWETALRLDLPAKMARLGQNIAIQGELCGHNINKNRERIPGDKPEFFVFSIYHIETRKFIHPRKVVLMAEELKLKHVPVVGYVKIQQVAVDREELKKRARQRKGEGLVYKCLQDGRSFKVISSTYLLEHNL